MKSNALLLVLLCLVLQSPAPAKEKPEGKKPPAPAAKRKFTDEERKLLAEAERRSKQAIALESEGYYAEAEREHWEALFIGERVLSGVDPVVVRSSFNLTLCLEAQKKFRGALTFIERVERSLQKAHGAGHPDTKKAKQIRERIEAAMNSTAPAAGRTYNAEEQKLLNEAEKRIKLAYALRDKGKFVEAEKEFRAVLTIQERVLGVGHSEVARTLCDLAMSLVAQKKYEEALAFLQRAEKIWRQNLGDSYPLMTDVKKACGQI